MTVEGVADGAALPGGQDVHAASRPRVTLEFALPAEALPRLLRAPALAVRRTGALRNVGVGIVWHDTAKGALAAEGLCLSATTPGRQRRADWRVERLAPSSADPLGWLPAHAPPALPPEAAARLTGQAALAPVAACQLRQRTLQLALPSGRGRVSVLSGTLRGVVHDVDACEVSLHGAPADVVALAGLLAETLPLMPSVASLAARALAAARGHAPCPRRSGTPTVLPGMTVQDGFVGVAAHLVETVLHWAGLVPQASVAMPVHQMRVAVRRLRGALSVHRRALADADGGAPWLDTLSVSLRTLAGRLGSARDWDVFLAETAGPACSAMPQDRRLIRLVSAAARHREAAYADLAAYLAGQDWTRLAMRLALLPTAQPWVEHADPSLLGAPAPEHAGRALERQARRLLQTGADLAALPPARLHDVRKQAKRLRYAAEFFAPLFDAKPARRYLRRLERLQSVLGVVNDAEVASNLLAQLAGGAERAYAAGLVQGFGAARAGRARTRVLRDWGRFQRAEPFWT